MREDLAAYQTGIETVKNFFITPKGKISMRAKKTKKLTKQQARTAQQDQLINKLTNDLRTAEYALSMKERQYAEAETARSRAVDAAARAQNDMNRMKDGIHNAHEVLSLVEDNTTSHGQLQRAIGIAQGQLFVFIAGKGRAPEAAYDAMKMVGK